MEVHQTRIEETCLSLDGLEYDGLTRAQIERDVRIPEAVLTFHRHDSNTSVWMEGMKMLKEDVLVFDRTELCKQRTKELPI